MSQALCLSFHICTMRAVMGKMEELLPIILSADRGVLSACSVPGSKLGAGNTVVNRANPGPALRTLEYQGKLRPGLP